MKVACYFLSSPIHHSSAFAVYFPFAIMTERYSDPAWPPGTVRLQQIFDKGNSHKDANIILQPRPTADPNDPLNWTKKQKILNYSLACYYAMMVFAFVNATSPTWGPMGDELGFSSQTLTNTYAIGCATLALGAPMLIPFALKYGSRPVYILSSVAQFAISIWAAKTVTAGDWWGVNSLQCWIGSLAEVLIQMTVADLFFVHQRGLMNTIYIWAYNVGSNLAVVASGFITDGLGWRWVWWFFAIFFGAQSFMFFFGFEETKYSVVSSLLGGQRNSLSGPTDSNLVRNENEKDMLAKSTTPTSDIEAGATNDDVDAARNLSVVQRTEEDLLAKALPPEDYPRPMVPLPPPLLPAIYDPRLNPRRRLQLHYLRNLSSIRYGNDHRIEYVHAFSALGVLRLTDRPHEHGAFHRQHTGIVARGSSERLRRPAAVEAQRRNLRAGVPLLLLPAFHPFPVRRSVVFCECAGRW
jgi:hypothetical protein